MSENKVNGFFVAPTALRAIKLADPQTIEGKKYNIDRYVSIDFRDISWSVRHRYREYSVEIPNIMNAYIGMRGNFFLVSHLKPLSH